VVRNLKNHRKTRRDSLTCTFQLGETTFQVDVEDCYFVTRYSLISNKFIMRKGVFNSLFINFFMDVFWFTYDYFPIKLKSFPDMSREVVAIPFFTLSNSSLKENNFIMLIVAWINTISPGGDLSNDCFFLLRICFHNGFFSKSRIQLVILHHNKKTSMFCNISVICRLDCFSLFILSLFSDFSFQWCSSWGNGFHLLNRYDNSW